MAGAEAPQHRVLVMIDIPALGEVRKGIPAHYLDRLKEALEVSDAELADVVGIARQTMVRRKHHGVLRRDESDRAAMVGRVYNAALAFFDNDWKNAVEWLKQSNPILMGETPLERANTAVGAGHVIDLIGRMAHGIPP